MGGALFRGMAAQLALRPWANRGALVWLGPLRRVNDPTGQPREAGSGTCHMQRAFAADGDMAVLGVGIASDERCASHAR